MISTTWCSLLRTQLLSPHFFFLSLFDLSFLLPTSNISRRRLPYSADDRPGRAAPASLHDSRTALSAPAVTAVAGPAATAVPQAIMAALTRRLTSPHKPSLIARP